MVKCMCFSKIRVALHPHRSTRYLVSLYRFHHTCCYINDRLVMLPESFLRLNIHPRTLGFQGQDSLLTQAIRRYGINDPLCSVGKIHSRKQKFPQINWMRQRLNICEIECTHHIRPVTPMGAITILFSCLPNPSSPVTASTITHRIAVCYANMYPRVFHIFIKPTCSDGLGFIWGFVACIQIFEIFGFFNIRKMRSNI